MKMLRNTELATYTGPMGPGPQADGDPRDFFRVLWRRKWVILLCVTLIPLAVYIYSDRLTKSYQASTIVQVQNTATDAGLFVDENFATGTANTAKIAALVGTSGVADEAARLMGEPEGSLRGAITATDDEDTGFITLTATAGSGERAAEIANTVAKALRVTREDAGVKRVDASIANVEKDLAKLPAGEELQRSQLSERLQGLRALRAAQAENTQVVEAAGVPRAPVSPNPKRNAILAFVVALLIAAGAVALAERLDRRLHDSRDLE